jgi:hypothetical protein
MSKELMWVCAILPQELNESLLETCRKEDKFDMEFKPHISLFTKGNDDQFLEMRQRLRGKIKPMELVLNRFVVGSSRHGDEYFNV